MNNNERLAHTNGPQNGPGEFAQLDRLSCETFCRVGRREGCGAPSVAKGPRKTPARRPGNGAAFRTWWIRHRKTLPPTSGFVGAETTVCAKTDPKNVPLFACTHAKHEELYEIIRNYMQ